MTGATCTANKQYSPLTSADRRHSASSASGVAARRLGERGFNPVLEIRIEETENYTLCRPSGELDAYSVAAFKDALTRLASHPRLLIDLSDVPFMDSAGLGALIGGIRRAREAEGAVAVACNRPALTRLLHTTGFDRIVPVTETLEEAEEALGEE